MTDELIKRLRKHVFYGDVRLFNFKKHSPLAMEAADTIEALQARVDVLEAEKAQAAKAERDRIVAWLRDDARLTEIEARRILGNLVTLTQADTDDWAKLIAMKHGIADALESQP